MGTFTFGKKSKKQLNTCHKDLQLIMNESLKVSEVDFAANEGHRSDKLQLKYFLQGYSKLDPRDPEKKKKAKHLKDPSQAVDIKVYVKGRPDLVYDKKHLCYLAGIIMTTAKRLLAEKKITHKLRWGGNWDKDGIILYDHTLQDYPHYEIYK